MGKDTKSKHHAMEKARKEPEERAQKKSTKKRIFSAIAKIILFPYKVIAKGLLRKKKKAPLQTEREEPEYALSSEYGKRVTFSDMVAVHTYVPRRTQKTKISLKSMASSYPPASLDMAKKIKNSARETPLARRILENLDKKVEENEQIKRLLGIRKKSSGKKSKNKIITILGKYTALSDSPESQEQEHPPSKPEKKKSRKSSKKKAAQLKKKKAQLEYSEDFSSAASRAYESMIRKDRTSTPL